MTRELGDKIQLVGDDLFVTNTSASRRASTVCGELDLNQVNQTDVSETLDAIALARRNGYTSVISHRSVRAKDTFIADLAWQPARPD